MVVLQKCNTPHSYIIQTETGELGRNRRHHKLISPPGTPSHRDATTQRALELSSTPPSELEQLNPTVTTGPALQPSIQVTRSGRIVRPPDRHDDFVLK